jgi:uncharacterized protein (DUF1697 family)
MPRDTVYILLFRGVGGPTQLPTAPLRAALTKAGFENVATYINSGNAVVRSRLGRDKVIAAVAEICRKKFGFTKRIFAPTLAEWSKLIENNPFPKAAIEIPKYVHAAVLDDVPAASAIAAIQAAATPREGFAVVDRVAYLHTPDGFGPSEMRRQFDAKIGVANTARNWNTVLKLHALATAAGVPS